MRIDLHILKTHIDDVFIIKPKVFSDERGFFFESFNKKEFERKALRSVDFVQDNRSESKHGVLRGLHYQLKYPQAKLVCAVVGSVYDVAVDLRCNSVTFGSWVGTELSAHNKHMLWIPEGFAHGFLAMDKTSEVLYKVSSYYVPHLQNCIIWNDPNLAIDWPLDRIKGRKPLLSARDQQGLPFIDTQNFF